MSADVYVEILKVCQIHAAIINKAFMLAGKLIETLKGVKAFANRYVR